jgi:hypothetical protein
MNICAKEDIRKGLIRDIKALMISKRVKSLNFDSVIIMDSDFSARGQAFKVANAIAAKINKLYNSDIVGRYPVTGGHELKIKPPASLIDAYYQSYIEQYNANMLRQTSINQFGDSQTVNKVEEDVFEEVPVVDVKEETSPVVEELMTYDQIAKQREFEDLVKRARLDEEMGINMFGDSFGPEKISLQEGYINPETEPVLYKNYVNKYNLQNNSNITGYEFLKDTEDEVFDMSSFYNFLQEEGFVGIDLSYYDLSTVNFDDYNQDVRKNDNFNNGIDPIAGFPVPPSC